MVAFTSNFRLTKPDFNSIGWDVQLNSDLDIIDSILGQFNTGLTIQGVWLNATLYPAGVSVIDGLTGHVWLTSTTHTSSALPATFANDRASFPTYWTDITNPAISASVSAAASAASAASAAASLASITGLLAGGTTGTGRVVLDTSPTIVSATFATTVVLTGVVSGAGIIAYFASPPPLGATAPNTAKVTTLQATGQSTLAGIANTGLTDVGVAPNIQANARVLFRGFLNGLITSRNAGAPTTKIDISIGAAMDEVAQAGFIVTNGVLTIDFGTVGANGIDTGSLVNNTCYHIHVIGKPDGTVAGFGSTSLTPTLPSGYTLRRRVWSVRTAFGAATFIDYSQVGDEGLWKAQISDIDTSVSGALGTTAALYALSTPFGVQCTALIRGTMSNAGAGASILINSPDETSIAGGAMTTYNRTATAPTGGTREAFTIAVRTNTASQIRAVADAATTAVNAWAYGWIDTRGKLS